MKKVLSFILILSVIMTVITGCGGGKYADVKAIYSKYINVMGTYLDAMDKADNAKEVAKAMSQFADDLEKIMPALKAMADKYPELKDVHNPPPDLKEDQEKANALGMKIGQTFGKVMPYMDNPDVKKAQEKLMAVMASQMK